MGMNAARTAAMTASIAIRGTDGVMTKGTADFSWCIEDAAAVRIEFKMPSGHVKLWVVGRVLLMMGVNSPAMVGVGDFSVGWAGTKATRFTLNAPEGAGEVILSTAQLVRFLDACEGACPVGSPAEDERVSAFVGAWLTTQDITTTGPADDEELAINAARLYLADEDGAQ